MCSAPYRFGIERFQFQPLHWARAGWPMAKVAKSAKKDMYVKDNVHNMQSNAMHATVHAMKNVKKTSGQACAQW